MRILTKEEEEKNLADVIRFVNNNPSHMFNHMIRIKRLRKEGAEKERKRIIDIIKDFKIPKELKDELIIKIRGCD